jgi:hypothetical protein
VTSLDPTVRTILDEWGGHSAEPSWEDVLRRAGVRPHAGPAARTRRNALATGLALLVVLLAVPQFGIGGRLKDLIGGSKRPGLPLGTTLVTADGARVGTFSARTSRLFITVGPRRNVVPHAFSHRPARPVGTIQVRWTLALERSASDARIERVGLGRPHVLARLCATCSRSTQGTLRLGRNALGAFLNGNSAVVVTTSAGTARGVLTLRLPARR